MDQTVFHHSDLKKSPDEFKPAIVSDPFSNACHQPIVIDPIEELFEIEINHDIVAHCNIHLRLGHRLMREASWPEAVNILGERRIPT